MDFKTFHHAYPAVLRSVFEQPEYRNSPRGFPSVEQLGVRYRLLDPTQRVPLAPARRLNIVFNYAEALWYLSGRDDLDFIAYYAPGMRKYSADGVRLTGTAYGRALFGRDGDGRSQWQRVVDELRGDPDSKRAVLQIFRSEELLTPGNPDVSCTLGLQFLLREGALHAVAMMRANDAYRGMSSDVFSFTFLQEMLARELGVQLGEYTHFAGSLHVYDPDRERVAAVLADPASGREPEFTFPALPEGDNRPHVREVLRLEEALRRNELRLGDERLDLPDYWVQVVLLFEVHRRLRREEPVDEALLGRLWPVHRWLLSHRWPSLPAVPGRPQN
ncbi:thymidylate synthase [Streptomyces sp. RerS4]|uniref:thymidylate synthase n=1 Tax=Streptomyces sp. RerS4 TaxID=2942449 RepID=UPI00201C6744|nr:thymidylate synthase [Streptomyces sp. RerS4]UQX03457.1 thymidylate synthase [Streptomyces sp. RerS4]